MFDPDALLAAVDRWRGGGSSLRDLFLQAGVQDVSDDELLSSVYARLSKDPGLIDSWQQYSWDKRWSPSPFLDGLEVGHYDDGRQNAKQYASPARACADFVLREVRWVISKTVVADPPSPPLSGKRAQ